MRHSFGRTADFTLGVEEELLLVDDDSHRLAHRSSELLAAMGLGERAVRHDIYEAQIELSSPACDEALEAARSLAGLRAALRDAGGTAIGAGIHPSAAFGDVRIVDERRYRHEAKRLQGLVNRTPDCALHVHVGMPDAETAIRVCNGLREWLPLVEALAANSPFWHGLDSGLGSSRRVLRRGFPRVDIPPPFRDFADYEEVVADTLAAAELDDYTLIWWEVRPHPRLGTVEVRAMDSQSSLATVASLAALVQGLAKYVAEDRPEGTTRHEVLAESSFRAGRYGVQARLYDGGSLRPAHELIARAVALARPHARELGSEAALDELERITRDGNGADRQRAAHRSGGMTGVLDMLAAETRTTYG
jgi:carboxylate-amine ligase